MRVNLEARAANAEQRRAKTRLRLIEAAMDVIAHKGPDAASIEDFVAAAGVSRGTFYNYFPTVEELLKALNGHLAERFDQRLAAAAEGVRDPALVLALILHASFRIVTTDPLESWVALRIDGTSTPRQALVAARFDAIYLWAVSRGRFRATSAEAARNLTFGAMRTTLSEIVSERCDLAHTADLVTLLLTAFGLDPEEAARLSQAAAERVSEGSHYSPVM